VDRIHHIAIEVKEIQKSVDWYISRFDCEVAYQDATWALLNFDNISLAMVMPGAHPPHLGITKPDAERFGELKTHRDGSRSIYLEDNSGNAVEILDAASV